MAARTVGNRLETLSKCLNMICAKFGTVSPSLDPINLPKTSKILDFDGFSLLPNPLSGTLIHLGFALSKSSTKNNFETFFQKSLNTITDLVPREPSFNRGTQSDMVWWLNISRSDTLLSGLAGSHFTM